MHTLSYLRSPGGTDERGAALVEYTLLLALVAIICIMAITTLGEQSSTEFTTVGTSIAAAGTN